MGILKMTPSALLVIAMLAVNAVAETADPYTLQSLKGVKTVLVVLVADEKDLKPYELDKATLETKIELHLRKAGLTVISPPKDSPTPLTDGIFQIEMSFTSITPQSKTVGAEITFQQMVTVPRTGGLVGAATWRANLLGWYKFIHGRKLQDKILDSVDIFANDWLAANQKNKSV